MIIIFLLLCAIPGHQWEILDGNVAENSRKQTISC